MSSSDSPYYNLLRKTRPATQCSNNAPEVACCHQRTLRNSKTLLYRIVTNTLTPPLHFAKQIYTCFCMHFTSLTASLQDFFNGKWLCRKCFRAVCAISLMEQGGIKFCLELVWAMCPKDTCEFAESRINQTCRTLHLGNTKQAGLVFEA